ncbi:MAG: 30S ribosomal protein S8 [Dehalococcoidales bacterium]|nr:30S ribosomal protein S8 [Dehalococcoidales bacterium]
MSITDPIADMLTRMRNGLMVHHDSVMVPASKVKLAIAQILKNEGFIKEFEVVKDKTGKSIKITLKYAGKNQPAVVGLERISKPGLRVYVERGEIPRVYGGLGIAIISTPNGIMTGKQAWRQNVGGEILCYVW